MLDIVVREGVRTTRPELRRSWVWRWGVREWKAHLSFDLEA